MKTATHPALSSIVPSLTMQSLVPEKLGSFLPLDKFHTLRSIFSQPGLLQTLVNREIPAQVSEQFAPSQKKEITHLSIVGTGTSLHAAELGKRLFTNQRFQTEAVSLSDFVDFRGHSRGEAEAKDIINEALLLISHRGNKYFAQIARKLANNAQIPCINLSGEHAPIELSQHDTIVTTVPQETSSMHTASFTASVLILAKLALSVDQMQPELSHEIQDLPMKVQSVLDQWEVVMRIARQPWREVIFVGSGAEGIIAREGALKLKEAAYIHAEGFDVETFLHGPLLGVSPDALVILLRTSDPHGRMNICAEFLDDVGIAQWSIGPRCDVDLPIASSPLSALPSVVPLQLFAAFSALTRGLDPGCFRKDEQKYANALGKITL